MEMDARQVAEAIRVLQECGVLSASMYPGTPEVHVGRERLIEIAAQLDRRPDVKDHGSYGYWKASITEDGVTYFGLFTDGELPQIGYRVVERPARLVLTEEVAHDVQPHAS